jgi:hypothetical protein
VSIDEIREFRTGIGGAKKAEQIRKTGAELVVAPCANCKKQLREVCEDHGLDHVRVVGLHDLLVKAIVPPPAMLVESAIETDADEKDNDAVGEFASAL